MVAFVPQIMEFFSVKVMCRFLAVIPTLTTHEADWARRIEVRWLGPKLLL